MADLEVLVKEKNTAEFLGHAHDIRPSARDKTWREMVSQMATLALSEAQSFRPINKERFDHIQSISEWPVLKVDDYFKLKRADFTKAYLSDCFDQAEAIILKECLPRAQRFVATSQNDPNFGLFLVKLLGVKFKNPPKKVYDLKLNLLTSITTGEFSQEFCGRDDIKAELRVLLVNLAKEELTKNPKTPTLDLSLYATPECLKSAVSETDLNPLQSNIKELSARYLLRRALGLLTTSERDYFLTYYLLSNPTEGEIFNLAWNNLKSLSSDQGRRNDVLKRLKTHPRPPDETFGSEDIRLKRTLTEAFLTYFPEYTDFYIKECHRYLAGEAEYPRGNPTPYCDDLILISRMKGTITDEVYQQHSALKKFRPIK